jgi:serine/threonine-protein kinase
MSDEPRVQQLLDEILDSDRTPEEVCADCPDLLAEVHRRFRQIRILEAELDSLFPPTFGEDADTAVAAVPEIPGYQVDGVIGRGGMGIVYKALHLRLNRTVALKMLLAGVYAGGHERQRFLREAEAVAALRHPNVVQIYDMGEHDGRPYFTMELVEGGNLKEKVAGTPQPAAWAASLTATLAGAVHLAHQSGIVHRDLKPANVLLTADGTPKVTDFGLASRLEDKEGLTLHGVLVGTPSYMAPEQARSDKSAIGPATDVYALGAILYEMLTGRPPFRADTATATLRQVMDEEPASPTGLNSRVPRDLETICLKCLQKGPSERYASAAALADDLRRFERHEPIAARPPGTLERAAKWVRRRPATAALLAAALLMVVGITSAGVWYAGDRARLHAEAQSRGLVANAALDQSEERLKDLRAKLDDAPQAWDLLSDIDHWLSMVEQARQDWQRAAEVVGDEPLVAKETRDRIQAVDAAVAREEAAYELAKELDDIALAALASYDSRRSKQRNALTKYEDYFSRQGLDMGHAGTTLFASAVRSSPARYALIAGLDTWMVLAKEVYDPRLARLLELARAADPDPWRDRFRDPDVWADRDALARFASGVDAEQQSPTVLASLGVLLGADGADPTPFFERALLGHPRDFWLHLRALQYTTEPKTKSGLAHALLAIRPQSAVGYRYLAFYLQERGDCPEAIIAARRAIDIDADDDLAYGALGLALRDTNDLHGAVVALTRAAEIDPHNPWPAWSLADVFLRLGDRTATADSYRKAAERAHNQVVFWNLGGCGPGTRSQVRQLKNQPQAVAVLQGVIEEDPADFPCRYILGQVFQQQGRYAEAEGTYLAASKARPDSFAVYELVARLLATCPDDKVRDGERAVEYATAACERSDWKNPFCLDTLAAAYAEAGQFDEAVRHQTRALGDPKLKGDLRTAATERLELYRQKKPFCENTP